ncbi:MAG: ABC transporter permease [Eubacteriales bacterium]|nr:ABC transporter permease [Eubacteriales bacterium]
MVTHSMLRRKLFRDMWKNRMQFVAVILLCALGTWTFSGLDALWRTLELTTQTYFDQQNVADLWINLYSVDREALQTVRATEGVKQVQARRTMELKADLPHEPTLRADAYDGSISINTPYLLSGEVLGGADLRGCLLDDGFASANGLSVGDKLTLKIGGVAYPFWIRGTCKSAEYLNDNQNTGYDPLNYGFVLLNSRAIASLPLNQLLVTLNDKADSDRIEKEIGQKYPEALIVNRQAQRSTEGVDQDVTMFHNLCYVFPLLAFAVAAMIVLTTLTRMLENQRMQMGTLKALGYRDRQIRRHYLSYAFYPSVVGSFIGLFVGRNTLPNVLWEMEKAQFQFPYRLVAPVSWSQWAVCGLGVVLACAICSYTYRKSAQEQTASLLRPKPPKAGQKLLLERLPRLWGRMGFNAKMVSRNLMRNKGRTAMSLIGVLCCTMLIITSLGLQDSVAYFVGKYYKGTLAYTDRANLSGEADEVESYRKRIDADRVEGLMELSVSARSGQKSRTTSLTVMEDDQQLMLLGKDEVWMALPSEGVLLSEKLSDVLGLQSGDSIEIWLAGDREPIATKVSGIAYITVGQSVIMSRSVWEGCKKGAFVPSALLLRGLSDRGRSTVEAMDEWEDWDDPAQQYEETLDIMNSMMGIFTLMSGVALGLAFVVLYNMGILNFSERCREYATLKVLGYHQKEIRKLMTSENNLLTGLGVLLGVGPGRWLIDAVLSSCESDSMVFLSTVSLSSLLIACLGTYAFSWLVTRFLTRKVKTIDMVEALKSVE